eukprot:233877-Pelagomonas_calceolata.AAC.7
MPWSLLAARRPSPPPPALPLFCLAAAAAVGGVFYYMSVMKRWRPSDMHNNGKHKLGIRHATHHTVAKMPEAVCLPLALKT